LLGEYQQFSILLARQTLFGHSAAIMTGQAVLEFSGHTLVE
jgi:hypothetical protein